MGKDKDFYPQCAICETYACSSSILTGEMNPGEKPDFCPLKVKPEIIRHSVEE